ncbi:MAG: hypothetical protein WCH75_04450 [Candidatus Binatia bacterium]
MRLELREFQTLIRTGMFYFHAWQKGPAKTMKSQHANRIDTTLGELIAAASEVAFEYSENDKDAYRLARLALIEMLKKATRPIDVQDEFLDTVTRKTYLN